MNRVLKSSFGKECCMLESEVSGYKQCIIYGDVHVFVLQFVPKDSVYFVSSDL